MKRKIAFLAVCAAVLCCFVGCQPKESKKEETKIEYANTQVSKQMSDSYEDALKECFDATYSLGGGEVFYAYMYPNAAIDAMKASGEYEKLIATFNQGQENRFSQNDDKFTFEKITNATEITDKQIEGIKGYFKEMCEEFVEGVTEEQFTVGKGYEVTFSYLNNGEQSGSETVIILKLNDEGWKVITA